MEAARQAAPLFQRQPPIFYAGDALHRIKQDKVQSSLAASGFDAFIFFKAEAVRYITDFYAKGYRPFMELEYFVLVLKDKPPVVGYVAGSDDLRIKFKSDIQDARKLPPVAQWATTISQILMDYGLARGRVGTDFMPYMVCDALREAMPGIEVASASAVWAQLTAVKHPLEVALIRDSIRVADLGVEAAIAAISPGVSEHSVAAEAVSAMRRNGSEFEPFIPLVASGYNTSMFERVATEKIIQSGEMVILDLGSVVRGYTADLGRTVICGEPSEEQRSIYRATHLALQEAKKLIRPGVSGRQIDQRARDVILDSEWGRYLYGSNTGHQLGYGLHGDPLVDRNADFEVVENMVMCLEPRIVLPDRPDVGGAHLEDIVLVTPEGHEQLNRTPYDARLLD